MRYEAEPRNENNESKCVKRFSRSAKKERGGFLQCEVQCEKPLRSIFALRIGEKFFDLQMFPIIFIGKYQ